MPRHLWLATSTGPARVTEANSLTLTKVEHTRVFLGKFYNLGRHRSFLGVVKNLCHRDNSNHTGAQGTRVKREGILEDFARKIDKEFGLRKAENLKPKHVEFVLAQWKKEGDSVGTLQNKMSAVRHLFEHIIHKPEVVKTNKELDVGRRIIDYNTDKGWTPSEKLLSEVPDYANLHLRLMRELGLRFEEALKFRPEENVKGNGRIHIHYGTKGDRERDMTVGDQDRGFSRDMILASDRQKQLISDLFSYLKSTGSQSISLGLREKYVQSKDHLYYIYKKHGVTGAGVGTPHGLRHQYAQDRYHDMTGMKPPAWFNSKEERREYRATWTDKEKEMDREARQLVSNELGHNRLHVTNNYLGSWHQ